MFPPRRLLDRQMWFIYIYISTYYEFGCNLKALGGERIIYLAIRIIIICSNPISQAQKMLQYWQPNITPYNCYFILLYRTPDCSDSFIKVHITVSHEITYCVLVLTMSISILSFAFLPQTNCSFVTTFKRASLYLQALIPLKVQF